MYIHRGRDIIIAWNYPQHKEVKYLYSDWVRRQGKAYSTTEVGAIIGRDRGRVNHYVQRGELPAPAATYSLTDKPSVPRYYFSEKQVLEVHEFFCGVQNGRPTKDFRENANQTLTPRSEVQRILAGDKVLYKKDSKGHLVPVWKAEEI